MKKTNKRRSKDPSAHVIPPAIPDSALPGLVFKRDKRGEDKIREYVEWQAKGEKVLHAEHVTTEYVLGRKLEAWDVRTDKTRWWVITDPTNLYSQELFPSLDYTISFHVGVTTRMMSEPDADVHPMQKAFMRAPWRKWEQASESLKKSEEPEDFQAVGMRCRECLISMVKLMVRPEFVPSGSTPPKRGDVSAWCDLIANYCVRGSEFDSIRKYLKDSARSAWQLVNWLTHASNAREFDAEMALRITEHILVNFGSIVFRRVNELPDRCPRCGSYKIILALHRKRPSSPGCLVCGWIRDLDPKFKRKPAKTKPP
jgi:ribosomal protein S27AE